MRGEDSIFRDRITNIAIGYNLPIKNLEPQYKNEINGVIEARKSIQCNYYLEGEQNEILWVFSFGAITDSDSGIASGAARANQSATCCPAVSP